MQAGEFIRKWGPGGPAHDLTERAGAQAHFIDLCRVLGLPEPGDPEAHCFERGLTKTGSLAGRTDGWTDWRPDWTDDEILRRLLALNRARAGGRARPPLPRDGVSPA